MRLFGAPVYFNPLIFVVAVLLGAWALEDAPVALSVLVSYLAVILVHECGHAAVARLLGHRVNAIHIGLIHGSCEFDSPWRFEDNIFISWGGVAAQVLVAVLVFSVAAWLPAETEERFGVVVVFLGYINLSVAAFNLAPTPPLDGALAWKIFPLLYGRLRRRWRSGRRRWW